MEQARSVHGDGDEGTAGRGCKGVEDAYTRVVTAHRASIESGSVKA